MTSALTAGFAFGMSLIVVIGPQNVLLIRVGMLQRGVGAVVAVCTGADVALILAGTAGAGVVIGSAGWVLTAVRCAGAIFLLGYALSASARVVRGRYAQDAASGDTRSIAAIVASACALTFLNPAVYLDTVVLLGSVAHTHAPSQWWFALGAAAASATWFATIGFGARRFASRLGRPVTWRLLDVFVVVVMTVTAVRLLRPGS